MQFAYCASFLGIADSVQVSIHGRPEKKNISTGSDQRALHSNISC